MRAGRLLSLLLLLQNRGLMTAPALADELGVSVRTVYRDIAALGEAGVPVYAEQGPVGGYRLLGGYRTRLTGLTEDEAGSLFLTGMPGPAAELGLGGTLATAELKLSAALPVTYAEAAARIRARFHLDARGWAREPEEVPHLPTVADALWRELRVTMRYRRWEPRPGVVERTVDPLGLVLKAGTWYFVAARDGEPRTYKVASIASAEVAEDSPARRPPGFVLASYWDERVTAYEERAGRLRARVALSPKGWSDLPDVLPGPGVTAAIAAASGPGADGWRQVVLPVESVPLAVSSMLRLGAGARVLDPPELVAAMRAEVAALGERYEMG